MNVKDYIGLTKKRAQDKAEADNLIFRLLKIDNEDFFSFPTDKRTDRICIEITKGVVSKAVIH